MQNDFVILVLSCDKYSDTWDVFSSCMKKFWPSCKFDVFLVNNTKEYKGITTINTGVEKSWSNKVRLALNEINSKYVMIMLDDYFIYKNLDDDYFSSLLNYIESNNIDYYSFEYNRDSKKIDKYSRQINDNAIYGKVLQAGIWKKNYLIKCLYDDDFSAWEFENYQKKDNVRRIKGNDCCTNEKKLFYLNGIIQGKWYPNTLKKLSRQGVEIDKFIRNSNRIKMNFINVVGYRLKKIALRIIPVKLYSIIKKVLKKMGVKFVTK